MMQVPLRTEPEALSHEVFNALMWALSYPGKKQATQHANLVAIGQTLLDLETSFYAANEKLAEALEVTGAAFKELEQADYLFFSQLEDAEPLRRAKRGNLLYPDHSATLVFHCQFAGGVRLELSGPGVETTQGLSVAGLPESFWVLRNQTRKYPLGWDLLLCDGENIVGIPRSAEVTLEMPPSPTSAEGSC